jgi:hypothetical protein
MLKGKEVGNMTVESFQDLKEHVGHEIKCVCYSDGEIVYNVALECETCCEVLVEYDNPEVEDKTFKD